MRFPPAVAVLCALSGPALPAGPPELPPPSLGQEEAARLAAEVTPAVEELRGLKFKASVPVRVVDDRTAREHFQSRIEKFLPEEELRALNEAYILLGVLPEGTDLLEMVFDLLEEQAGGYYDPERDTFFILGDMPRAIAPVLIVHELTHALDDQHYGIDSRAQDAGGTGDRAAALGSVVEGSGTAVMLAYLQREILSGGLSAEGLLAMEDHEAGRAEKLRAAPPALHRMLLAPYVLGHTFLLRGDLLGMLKGVDPADISTAMERPPMSTEQILHAEKYWDPDKLDVPRPLEVPDLSGALGKGWSRKGSGDLGELLLAVLTGAGAVDPSSLTASVPGTWTNDAAAGWGADRWHLYERGPQRAAVLVTLWDSQKDASEFTAAVEGRPGRKVVRRSDAVVVIAGDAAGRSGKLAEAALAAAGAGPDQGARP